MGAVANIGYGQSNNDPSQGPVVNLPDTGNPPPITHIDIYPQQTADAKARQNILDVFDTQTNDADSPKPAAPDKISWDDFPDAEPSSKVAAPTQESSDSSKVSWDDFPDAVPPKVAAQPMGIGDKIMMNLAQHVANTGQVPSFLGSAKDVMTGAGNSVLEGMKGFDPLSDTNQTPEFESALKIGSGLGRAAAMPFEAAVQAPASILFGDQQGNKLASDMSNLAQAGSGFEQTTPLPPLKNIINPNPLPSDVANVVKAAETTGVTVPNAALLSADSWAANHTNIKGYEDYKAAVNQNAADLIGANDSGETHVTVNERALNSAKRNNSNAIQAVDSSIGNVPIQQRIDNMRDAINDGLPSDQSFWNRFKNDLGSKINEDGTIHAGDVRELTSYNSDLAKKARGTTNDAPVAQRMISQLKGAVNDAATPEQQAALFDVNNKYKLMSEFADKGKKLGAGARMTPEQIRDVINKAYDNSNEVQYPARVLQDTLNTFHPNSGVESSLRGLADAGKVGEKTKGFSPGSEFALGATTGHGMEALKFALAHKLLTWTPNKVTSMITNSQIYRDALLRNAFQETPSVPDAPISESQKLLSGPATPLALPNPAKETFIVESGPKGTVRTQTNEENATANSAREDLNTNPNAAQAVARNRTVSPQGLTNEYSQVQNAPISRYKNAAEEQIQRPEYNQAQVSRILTRASFNKYDAETKKFISDTTQSLHAQNPQMSLIDSIAEAKRLADMRNKTGRGPFNSMLGNARIRNSGGQE